MLNTILTSTLSFISTNIDDILMLTIFFTQCCSLRQRLQVALGQYLGIGGLTMLSLLGAYGLQLLPPQYIGLLGLLPIALGAKEIISYRKNGNQTNTEDAVPQSLSCFGVALVTIANGGDNIGVYIPLFSAFTPLQLLIAVITFMILTALWCSLAASLARLPILKTFIQKYKHIFIPTILILLGIYILLSAYLL